MKVYVEKDELYPVYYLNQKQMYTKLEIEISEDLYQRWQEAVSVFHEVQEELHEIIKGVE